MPWPSGRTWYSDHIRVPARSDRGTARTHWSPDLGYESEVKSAGQSRWSPRWPVLPQRSEEHTSELQSRLHVVFRLLLEKKNTLASRRVSISAIWSRSQATT